MRSQFFATGLLLHTIVFFSGYLSRKLCVRAKKQIVVVIIIINNSPWSQAAILALSQHRVSGAVSTTYKGVILVVVVGTEDLQVG